MFIHCLSLLSFFLATLVGEDEERATNPPLLPTYVFDADDVPKAISFSLVNTTEDEILYATANGTFRHLTFVLTKDGDRVEKAVVVQLAPLAPGDVHKIPAGGKVTYDIDLSSRYWTSFRDGSPVMEPGIYILETGFDSRGDKSSVTVITRQIQPAAVVVIRQSGNGE